MEFIKETFQVIILLCWHLTKLMPWCFKIDKNDIFMDI